MADIGSKEVLDLGLRLFPLFALALDLNEDFFADKVCLISSASVWLWTDMADQAPCCYPETPLLSTARRAGSRRAYPWHWSGYFLTVKVLILGSHRLRVIHDPSSGPCRGPTGEKQSGTVDRCPMHPWDICDQVSMTAVARLADISALVISWLDGPVSTCFFEAAANRCVDDVFLSTPHRALPPATRTRYSIPFFFGCDHDVLLTPIPTCVSGQSPAKYEVVTAGEYVHSRLTETYGHGEGNA
jgi:hypothetical protein